jgi:hypothetical protein
MVEPGLFRKRDLAMLLLVIVAIYLSLFESPTLKYSLEPAWFVDNRNLVMKYPHANSTRHRSPNLDYSLIPPIVTDLDGDSSNEIILINRDLNLQVILDVIDTIIRLTHYW